MPGEGKKSRRSGDSYEREVVEWLKKLGLSKTKRVPMSGAIQSYPDDIVTEIPGMGNETRIECKFRSKTTDKTRMLRLHLGDADLLFTRRKNVDKDHWVFCRGIFLEKLLRILLAQNAALNASNDAQGIAVDNLDDLLARIGKALS
tara:strand:+ start:6260 stop:6697 length:438 start_codon:yes stop_codon:yes gene_type:complete